MTANVFWTSDTHFGHDRILEFQRETRQGDTVEEMNEILIENWNKTVRKNDRIYHLGDFSFMSGTKTDELLQRLNGQIHLVLGNHDGMIEKRPELRKYFASVQMYKSMTFDGKYICMMHYPIEDWNRSLHGSIHLHGHVHGGSSHKIMKIRNRLDVGIDNRMDMTPWNWEEIKLALEV